MKILSFKKNNFILLKNTYNNERKIGYSIYNNVKLIGRNSYYPNVLIYSDNEIISPYDEKIMSLNKQSFYDNNEYDISSEKKILYKEEISFPVFFFIYNFDNYYHFVYDTISYLYTYLYLKNTIPTLKLLVNYPNPYKNEFYKFNIEILNKLVNENDIILHKDGNIYNSIYISSSLTHGEFSNNPPCKEYYSIINKLIKNSCNIIKINKDNDKDKVNEYDYIYISRRTWINNDISNIGTNYTTRRKMINEDELVEELNKIGFKEIFTENLSTDEKINIFYNSKMIVGSIGGGMSNLLFSKPETKSFVIVTPYFLDINNRFRFTLENTNITYINDVKTYTESNSIPLYCRCKILSNNTNKNKIGEIVNWRFTNNKEEYLINISNNDIVGFNNEIIFKQEWFFSDELELIDKGLNSPYIVNINKTIDLIKYTKLN